MAAVSGPGGEGDMRKVSIPGNFRRTAPYAGNQAAGTACHPAAYNAPNKKRALNQGEKMARTFRRIAGALVLALSGLVQAAPQLLVPVALPHDGPVRASPAKSSGTAVRFNAGEVFSLPPGAEVELTLPNGSRHTYLFESTVPHG